MSVLLINLLAQIAVPLSIHAEGCQFILGFKVLHELASVDIGDCVDSQAFAVNGDAQQHTTNGLLAWRKADNWTAFTNGYWTWLNGPDGLVKRLNTDRFSWEHDSGPPSGHVGPAASYPDASITPGSVDPRVAQGNIQQTICVSGYTARIRPPESYTEPLKLQQLTALGLPGGPSAYEEDHFVPLEVGGHPTDPKNLWPEAYAAVPGAHEKDRVENYLHDQVCAGAMTLDQAQLAVMTDWVAVYQQIAGTAVVAPSSASPATNADGHTFYASRYRTAKTIYCDTDPEWRTLSPAYLVSFPSLTAAQSALPTYALHRPC